jgi:hypothetical protein
MALEGPPRISVRRLDGLHPRHREEPQGTPSHLHSEAGDRLPVARIGVIISLSCEAILGVHAELRPPKVIYDRDQAVQRC